MYVDVGFAVLLVASPLIEYAKPTPNYHIVYGVLIITGILSQKVVNYPSFNFLDSMAAFLGLFLVSW